MEHTMHSLKTDPQVFEAVLSGKKTYEIRPNKDRVFKVGDFLRLQETQYTGEEMADKPLHNDRIPGKPLVYTGRQCLVAITHILEGPIYGLMAGWSLLSISLGDRLSIPADPRNGKPLVTNAMKAECIGEFYWDEEAPYYDENGVLHPDHVQRNAVPWDICKDIYKRMAVEAAKA